MNATLWILQGILAVMYALAGSMKSMQPIDKLVKTVTWADRFPIKTVRFIGIMELLGAIGLILPGALNIVPVLTPMAASGLALVMMLATFHHINHKEYKTIIFTLSLMILAALVAYGRFSML
jgi:uncharacterized membrane protein YphA (DoxX/SURF4 family)